MILQSLHHYYERKSKDPDSGLAPSGFEPAKISFVIVLDNEGKFVDIEDVREGTGKKKKGKSFLVPQSVKKSVNIAANLLWGSLDYLLGIDIKNKPDRVKKQKKAFVEKILTTFPQPETDAGILATVKFLQSPLPEALAGHALWEEIIKTSPNVTFRLQNDNRLICQRPVVIETLTTTENRENSGQAICLVTGQADETERLHPSIKGVWGAQSSGANIVSFNLGAVNSFTKEQGFNAPVGKRAAFNYTTALNHLLREGSPQRMQVGDASTAFWSEKENRFEDVFADFFQEPPKDDPGRNTRAVQALFSAPQTGTGTWEGDGTRFYILGLAPNVARISVRFWHNTTVGDLAQNIRLHFKDTEIVHPPHNPQYLSIFRLLVATAVQGKSDNIPPNLGGELMRSILEGTPYPQSLLQAAIRRIKAEREVTYPRAALLKASINRFNRRFNPLEKEVTVSLDETNINIGYRLGRLFAVLEKVQEEANPGITATIRDRYFSSASSTPRVAFPSLLRLKNHHIPKIDNRGLAVNREKAIGQIFDSIQDFPATLSLEDQGRFSIGYYHQRQNFFKKSENTEEKGK